MIGISQMQVLSRSNRRRLIVGGVLCLFALSAGTAAPQDMQVGAYLADGCVLYDHAGITGDDRGAIALSASSVLYTGDTDTGLFPLDLSSGAAVGFRYDGIVSDVDSGVVYSLANGAVPLQDFTSGTATIDTLLEVDPVTGALTGGTIALSSSIEIAAYSSGFFSGSGRIVVWDLRSPGAIYDIALPSGTVAVLPGQDLAYPYSLAQCEMGAFWGVAESVGGALYLDFAGSNYQAGYQSGIFRLDVSTGACSEVSAFSNLGDTCGITVDPAAERWYFHFEGSSQFGSGSEVTAYCTAAVATSGSADLAASSSGPSLSVALGNTVAVPIQVDNAGPDPATGVVLSITVPGTLEAISAIPSQGSCSNVCGEVVTCDLGALPAGNMATVTLQVEGVIEGQAVANFRAYGGEIDPDTSDNTGGRPVSVTNTSYRQIIGLERRQGVGNVEIQSWTPDLSTFLGSTPVSLPGEGIFAGNGLAYDPSTAELYAMLSLDESAMRRALVTIDPRSGVATLVGEPGDRFSALAIDDAGAVYGLTGQGAATPETLYELNRATAAPTLIGSLTNGEPGEALAFNDQDLLLYHVGGPNFFESVALPGPVQTNIPMCQSLGQYAVYAATHVQDDRLLVATSAGVRRLDTDGTHQRMPTSNLWVKGMVLLEPPSSDLVAYLSDSVDPVYLDDTFNYTATILNLGPDPIENLGFVDTLPGQVVGISATPSQGTCSITCDQVFCELGSIASSGSVTIGIEVRAVMAGSTVNIVSYSGFGDPSPSNNQASEYTTILEPATPGSSSFELYSLLAWSAEVQRIDPITFSVLESVPINLAGSTVLRGNGMAQHPVTGVFWVLLTLDGQFGRELVTVDPTTGQASSVGDTGDRFAGLAFDDNGVLYGVTGNGANMPRQLFTLDQTTAAATLFLDLSSQIAIYDGVSIAYHPANGLLYVTGGTQPIAVDPSGPLAAPVDVCRPFSYTANAATSWDDNSLLMVNDYGELYRFDIVTATGSSLNHSVGSSKGVVWTEKLGIFADGFESGDTTAWSNVSP